jgi:hypothetical protein
VFCSDFWNKLFQGLGLSPVKSTLGLKCLGIAGRMMTKGRILITGIAVFAVILTLIIAYTTEVASVLSSINPAGALAATFVAVVGLCWLRKTAKRT